MSTPTTTHRIDLPGFRVYLRAQGRTGWVELSQRASKALGHHCQPGHDGGQSARQLRERLRSEIERVARREKLERVEVYAAKAGEQAWTVDVVCIDPAGEAGAA